jgi:hypothetical protein
MLVSDRRSACGGAADAERLRPTNLNGPMARLTPAQIANRDRIEAVIGLAAPFLDVVLGVGDRISRIDEPGDSEYYPIRPGGPVPLPGEPGYAEDAALPDPEPVSDDGTGPRPPRGA